MSTQSRSSKKLFSIFPQKRVLFLLFLFSIFLSAFFALYKFNECPPCINADEAAFGYNAYSLLKTGADEYGTTLPVRLKSFGDYKMPLYSYLSVPFVGIFGLNETGIRALNVFIAILFPLVIYLLVKELFEKEEIAVIASLLVGVSLGKGIVERHAHEALLAAILIVVSGYYFIRIMKYAMKKDVVFFVLSITFALFSYQSSRLFAVFFLLCFIWYFFIKKFSNAVKKLLFALFIAALLIFAVTDIIYKPARVQNLFLTNTAGFQMRIAEINGEGGNKLFYNKLTIGVRDLVFNHIAYFSPQFLAINGDANYRFGFPRMAPMTVLEYIFIFIGIYFLFKQKERWRYFLLSLLLISPLTAALSWADISLTRGLFLLIVALLISSYGLYHIIMLPKKKNLRYALLAALILSESLMLFYSWDFYLNHYTKRAIVGRYWQCGYEDLGKYLKENYNKFDKFYITRKHGEPYIFALYYLQYPPETYQSQATLSAPDEFGFGQVEKFDKFIFSVPGTAFDEKKVAIIGYPDDFGNQWRENMKKITFGREEIFWIYEK